MIQVYLTIQPYFHFIYPLESNETHSITIFSQILGWLLVISYQNLLYDPMVFSLYSHCIFPFLKNTYKTVYFWENYNVLLTWIKAIWGWFPLLTIIPVRSQWGRYNML